MEITSGFLVVKRFAALHREFAEKPTFDTAMYALPVRGRGPERLIPRYRGLDRDAIHSRDKGSLAEARMMELKRLHEPWTDDFLEDFLPTLKEAADVLGWAEKEDPAVYEVIWTRLAGAPEEPPEGFVHLGFEPTYFGGDHFSAICDCMCFPRWHGPDPEGTLFLKYFERLNRDGLFDDASLASEFLAYYRSFDWTETGEYEIAEVWAPVDGEDTIGTAYREAFPKNSQVRVAERRYLEEFLRSWKYHHSLQPEQLAFAGRTVTVAEVSYYHGGDVLYGLAGVPGYWHEQCLRKA